MRPRLDEILKKTTNHFTSKGMDSPRLDAELILACALGLRRLDLYLKFDYPLNDEEISRARELVMRRAKGEPVAYILGSREFYKAQFIVRPGVLVPRPDTELLVELAVQELKKRALLAQGLNLKEPVVWDWGAGSGCIGLSVLQDVPEATLMGFDISPVAISVARENAGQLGLESRASFIHQAVEGLSANFVVENLKEKFPDVILANPPYIGKDDEIQASVKEFEPAEALFSEEAGLHHLRTWAKVLVEVLRPGGFFAFEIGSKQGPTMREFLRGFPTLTEIEIKKDLAGLDRCVCGKRSVF